MEWTVTAASYRRVVRMLGLKRLARGPWRRKKHRMRTRREWRARNRASPGVSWSQIQAWVERYDAENP